MSIKKHDVLRELYKERTAEAKDLSVILGCATKDVSKHLRTLREAGIIEMDKGLYRCTKETEKNIEFLVESAKNAKNIIEKAEEIQVPEVKPALTIAKKTAEKVSYEKKCSNVYKSLSELEEKLKSEPLKIENKQLKLVVLERLAALLSDDIVEVLNSIIGDISMLDEAV